MDSSSVSLLNNLDYRELLSVISNCLLNNKESNDIMKEVLLQFNIDLPLVIVLKFTKNILNNFRSNEYPNTKEELNKFTNYKEHYYKLGFKREYIEKIIELYDPHIRRFIQFYENVNDFRYTLYQLLCDLNFPITISVDTFYLLTGSVKQQRLGEYVSSTVYSTDNYFIIKSEQREKYMKVFRNMYGNKYDDILENLPKRIPFYNPFNDDR